MALERKILTLVQPTLAVDEMSTIDTTDPNAALKSNDTDPLMAKKAGALYPLVQINGYQLGENEIVSLRLDETGFIPVVSVTMAMTNGIFLSNHFPKDGDPISIFIKSKTDEFKPIRADFDITSVTSAPSADESGDAILFTFEGTLRILGLFSEKCKAFSEMTSMETLTQIASDLKMGFASNETSTSDKMTWICPFDTYDKFVKDVTMASFKSDGDFYQSWIDHFYFLNFVNVNSQFSEELDIEAALEVLTQDQDFFKGREVQKIDTTMTLSNHKTLRGMGQFINSYTVLNNAGQITIDNGFRRYTQFYDSFSGGDPANKYQSHFSEGLNTAGVTDKILLKGRVNPNKNLRAVDDKYFKEHNKYKWMGVQESLPKGNVHSDYLFSQIHNWQNGQELEKMYMRVTLGKVNFNLYRGQRIPVIIINEGTNRQKATAEPAQNENIQVSADKFLSGYYMIRGMRYAWSYTDAIFKHDVFLTRREWPIPNIKNLPA